MAAADFFARGGHDFDVAYFNHGTDMAPTMGALVASWAASSGKTLLTGKISRDRARGESKEDHWRKERYLWLRSFGLPVVTCHHLDDVVETWLFTAIHGNPRIIPARNDGVLRPFLLNAKESMVSWCVDHGVAWIEDPSNRDVSHPRNRIRHNIVNECLQINPGLRKVIRKKILQDNGSLSGAKGVT